MQAIISHPTSIIITGATAVIILFVEWILGTYKNTKNSLICVVAFIIDLTLTLCRYPVLSRAQPWSWPYDYQTHQQSPLYNTRKAPIHTSIRAWADRWTFSHVDATSVINKIQEILHQWCVKPEEWGVNDMGGSQGMW